MMLCRSQIIWSHSEVPMYFVKILFFFFSSKMQLTFHYSMFCFRFYGAASISWQLQNVKSDDIYSLNELLCAISHLVDRFWRIQQTTTIRHSLLELFSTDPPLQFRHLNLLFKSPKECLSKPCIWIHAWL